MPEPAPPIVPPEAPTVDLLGPDGSPLALPAPQATAAFRARKAALPPGRVPVRLATGELGTVDAHDVDQVIDQGGSLASQGEYHQADLKGRYQGTYGGAIAGVSKALDVTTGGLGSGAVADLTAMISGEDPDVEKEAIRASQELHPVTGFLGEMAGLIAPNPISLLGEAAEGKAVATLGKGAESALGRIAQRAGALGFRGGAENAALALGQAVEDAQLSDTPINGEKLAASVGYAGLTGAVVGAGIGGVGEGLTIARESASPAMRRLAGVEAARSVMPGQLSGGTLSKDITQRLGKDGMSEIGQELLDRGVITPGADTAMKFERIRAAKAEVGQQIGKLLEDVPAVGKPLDLYNMIDEIAAPYRKKATLEYVAEQLDGVRDSLGRQLGIVDAAGELLPDAAERTVGFEDLLEQRRAIAQRVYQEQRALPGTAKLPLTEMRAFERRFEGYLMEKGDEAERYFDRPDFLSKYKALKSSYQKLSYADTAISDKLAKETNRRYISLSDTNMLAGSLSAAAAGHPMALLAGPVNKVLRTYGPQASAWALNRVATMRAIGGEVHAFDRLVDSAVNGYLATSRDHKPLFDHVTIGEAAERDRTLAEEYDEHASQVKAAAMHPDLPGGVMGTMGDFAHHAPAMTAAVQQTAVRGVQFLASKLPATPPGDPLRPSQPVRPSASQMAKFLRYARAVDDPAGILDEIQSRKISPEAVEAIRTVYPSIWKEVQTKVLSRIEEKDEPLSYQARVQLSALFGIPAGPTLTPASRAASAAVYAAPAPSPQGQPLAKGNKGKRAVDVKAFVGPSDSDKIETQGDDKE